MQSSIQQALKPSQYLGLTRYSQKRPSLVVKHGIEAILYRRKLARMHKIKR